MTLDDNITFNFETNFLPISNCPGLFIYLFTLKNHMKEYLINYALHAMMAI